MKYLVWLSCFLINRCFSVTVTCYANNTPRLYSNVTDIKLLKKGSLLMFTDRTGLTHFVNLDRYEYIFATNTIYFITNKDKGSR